MAKCKCGDMEVDCAGSCGCLCEVDPPGRCWVTCGGVTTEVPKFVAVTGKTPDGQGLGSGGIISVSSHGLQLVEIAALLERHTGSDICVPVSRLGEKLEVEKRGTIEEVCKDFGLAFSSERLSNY